LVALQVFPVKLRRKKRTEIKGRILSRIVKKSWVNNAMKKKEMCFKGLLA
jgi:hypothetical protein